ncbi:MAG: cation diffusion facilitator family transporter [Pseudomonadota bacterium]|nr:cation diffusion facilitator family transporter [Pseudomonadota bacterium]
MQDHSHKDRSGHDHDHAHDHRHGHPHDHDHDHSHGGLNAHAGVSSGTRLKLALFLTAGFMVAEVVGGLWSGSLALLADAGHMLADACALALALWAQVQSRRPPDAMRSYGYHRMPVLVAFVNGLALLAIAAWISVEGVQRLLAPPEIAGKIMLTVAIGGLAVNALSFFILHGGANEDMNVRGAMLHVMGDLLGSVGAIVAAIVILFSGWMPIDPLLSILVALLIVRSAWRLVRESAHVLLEGAPEAFDAVAFAEALPAGVSGVMGVHHVHHWMLTPDRSVMTLHAVLAEGSVSDEVVARIKSWIHAHHKVTHITIQIEHGRCADDGDDAHHHKPNCGPGTAQIR